RAADARGRTASGRRHSRPRRCVDRLGVRPDRRSVPVDGPRAGRRNGRLVFTRPARGVTSMKASILAFLLSLAAASAFGQTAGQTAPVTPAAPSAPPAATAPPGATPSSAPTSVSAPFPASGHMTYAFNDLGAPQGLRLAEGSAEGGVTYMVRRDEVITAARLRLLLENSAGFPADTKLEVNVNGDAVGTIDVGTDRHSATPVDLPVDPILLGDYNRVGF